MSLKVLSLFAGIGAPEKALTNIGVPFEVVGFSEIDKYAIQSYCAIHNVDPILNLGDVSNIDYSTLTIKPDLVTGGSPCQDFSVSGKNKGSVWTCNECKTEYNPIQQHFYKRDKCIKCGSTNLDKTRSSLLVEYLRCIRELKPKYFLYENVKNILGKQHREVFELFAMELKSYGYDIFYQVLNAKDYGVPQNRERVFIVGCLGGNQSFVFPSKQPLTKRLKDVLEDNVPESYYLSDEKVQQFLSNSNNKIKSNLKSLDLPCIGSARGRNPENPSDRTVGAPTEQMLEINTRGTSNTITSVQKDNYVVEPKIERLGGVWDTEERKRDAGAVFSSEGIAPTITTMQGGWRQPCIVEESNVEDKNCE
ncbi:MAG: DNA cytosine methyltransferase [Paraclostridium sp.]